LRFSSPIPFLGSFLTFRAVDFINPDSTYSSENTSFYMRYTTSSDSYQLSMKNSTFSSPANLFVRFLDWGFQYGEQFSGSEHRLTRSKCNPFWQLRNAL
jgi:hypothetical protein